MHSLLRTALSFSALALAVGCGASAPQPFSLKFAAMVDDKAVTCTDQLSGFGTSSGNTIGLNDLRFYVSNVVLTDAAGKPVETTFDADDFQYRSTSGWVGLIDLASNTEGSCATSAVSGAEGTARTHLALTGTTRVSDVKSVSFDVGVPQAMMKQVIAENSAEGAPSPLAEMYWSWASGYRHFVFNFTVKDAANAAGEGYLHVGSRACGTMTGKALEDRAQCDFVNNPKVALSDFNLETDTVGIDLRRLLAGVDFTSPVYDANFMPIGTGPGVECHSSPSQPDCPIIFNSFGLDIATGGATASSDAVFVRAR